MRVDADRLDALRKAKLRAFAETHRPVPAGSTETSFPSGATLTDPSTATTWVFIEDNADHRLGGALAVALRARSETVQVITPDPAAAGIVARRARLLRGIQIGVWTTDGATLEAAEPAPPADDPVPPPSAELYRPVLEDAGLEAVVEGGALRGELLGLEAARVVVDADGTARLEAGIGRFDREAGAMMRSGMSEIEALRVVVDLMRPVRRAGVDHHPMNQLVPERWLRSILLARPDLVGATELRAVGSALPRESLRASGVASAVGRDDSGRPVVVTTSVGIDLDLVPSAADDRITHDPDARLVLVTPESDAAAITETLTGLLPDAELRTVSDEWASTPTDR